MMGVEHIENIAAVPDATVTAVADPHPASLERGVAAAGAGVVAFADHRELLASGLCDAVVIASPNMTHAAILLDAFATPHHILVEKPLCTTAADLARVAEAAAAHDHLVWVGLEYRYMAPVTRLVEEVRAGTVGDVAMIAIREHRFPFLDKVDAWNRFSRNTGGTLVEKCCHFFDLMNLIAGARPEVVYASGGQRVNHLDERYDGAVPDLLDHAFVVVDYPGGIRASLDLCMFAEATHNQEELSVVGTAGKVEALIPQNVVRIGRRGRHWIGSVEQHTVEDTAPYAGFHHGSSYREHLAFGAAIRAGSAPEVTVADGVWSAAAGLAAHRSIELGRPVRMTEVLEAPS
jgi:predicted dehydrogenase